MHEQIDGQMNQGMNKQKRKNISKNFKKEKRQKGVRNKKVKIE